MADGPYPEGATWAVRAACLGHPGLPWLGDRAEVEMLAVCGACPVRADCLAEALAQPTVGGVWAGTTPTERRRLRAGRRAPKRRR